MLRIIQLLQILCNRFHASRQNYCLDQTSEARLVVSYPAI